MLNHKSRIFVFHGEKNHDCICPQKSTCPTGNRCKKFSNASFAYPRRRFVVLRFATARLRVAVFFLAVAVLLLLADFLEATALRVFRLAVRLRIALRLAAMAERGT